MEVIDEEVEDGRSVAVGQLGLLDHPEPRVVRPDALLAHLPVGQALLTTAGSLPEGVAPDLVLHVRGGTIAT